MLSRFPILSALKAHLTNHTDSMMGEGCFESPLQWKAGSLLGIHFILCHACKSMLMFLPYFTGLWLKSKGSLQWGGPLSSWSPSHLLCPHSKDGRAVHEAVSKPLPFTACHLKMYLHKFQNEVEILISSGVLTFTMLLLESEPRDGLWYLIIRLLRCPKIKFPGTDITT